MSPRHPVGNPFDAGIRKRRSQELDLGRAGERVALGDAEDRAVVFRHQVGSIRPRGELGKVTVLVQDRGQLRHPIREGFPGHPLSGLFGPPPAPPLEDTVDECGVRVLDVLEELVRELAVEAREQGLPRRVERVAKRWTPGPARLGTVCDQACGRETGEVLSGCADGDPQGFGEFGRAGLPALLEEQKEGASG